jgi:hypothetical protein
MFMDALLQKIMVLNKKRLTFLPACLNREIIEDESEVN